MGYADTCARVFFHLVRLWPSFPCSLSCAKAVQTERNELVQIAEVQPTLCKGNLSFIKSKRFFVFI